MRECLYKVSILYRLNSNNLAFSQQTLISSKIELGEVTGVVHYLDCDYSTMEKEIEANNKILHTSPTVAISDPYKTYYSTNIRSLSPIPT